MIDKYEEITKEINHETAITESPRWYLEERLSKAPYSRGNQDSTIRVQIAKVENRGKIKVHRFDERQAHGKGNDHGDNTAKDTCLDSHGCSLFTIYYSNSAYWED